MPVPFGQLPDGREVQAMTLTGGGMTARVLTLGAVLLLVLRFAPRGLIPEK